MNSVLNSKTLHITALFLLVALLCAGVQAATATENTLTMSIGTMLDTGTDPTISSSLLPGIGGWQEYHFYTHFSPLIELDRNGNIIPWTAESYEILDGYKTVIFHLRDGVKFADGTPLNASVLKFNFDRIIKYGYLDKFGPNGTNSRFNIFIYYDFAEVIDEHTIKLHFTKGWLNVASDFCASSVYGAFISPLDVEPAWNIKGILKPEKRYNGLGPYYVDENESIPKEKVVLKRRNSWRDDLNFHKPRLDKILLTYIADTQTAVMALGKGDIDYICRNWNPSLDSLLKLKENSEIAIKTSPDTQLYYIATAYWKTPFNGTDGILLRKAINYALDRTEMAKGAFFGYATPATDTMYLSPLRTDVPECCHAGYNFDPEKAKKLFAEAGWNDTDGDGILDKSGTPLKLDLIISSQSTLIWMKDLALIVQSQLNRFGVDVEIRSLERNDYIETSKAGSYDMRLSYDQLRSAPTTNLLNYFRSGGILSTHYANENGTLEKSVIKAQVTLNEKEQRENLCQVSSILFEEAGVIPLVHPMAYAAVSSKVSGLELRPQYIYDHIEECCIKD